MGRTKEVVQPPIEASTAASPRRLGLLEATALNMTNMIGIGPFITIPILMTALGGPMSLLGWLLAMLVVIPDGMVWSELGAAMPRSGGSFRYLLEGFGAESYGRFAAFLFIFSFVLSGPLEIASGYIGLANYLGYLWKDMPPYAGNVIAAAAGVLNVALLYRRTGSLGRLTVVLWMGTLATAVLVIAAGAMHFDYRVAFHVAPGSMKLGLGFVLGLGASTRIGIYDYLGYYDVAYLAEEVEDPGRVIPRSILVSVVCVAILYVLINLAIIGTVPWEEFVPAADKKPTSDFIASVFMERIAGPTLALFFTLMVAWTAFGSVFALLFGYSRIPYAAAREGYFFSAFAKLHPTKNFPHVALLVLGAISIAASFLSLELVIDALIATRIVVQFIGQSVALVLLRRRASDLTRPYRVPLYPVPAVLSLTGFSFVFITSDPRAVLLAIGALISGSALFMVWSRARAE
jgi:amino acid transporter